MPRTRRGLRPAPEPLEGRLPPSASGAGLLPSQPSAQIQGVRRFGLSDLRAFAKAYLSYANDAFYNPNVDLNHNGFVGQGDGIRIEHQLIPLSPKGPLRLDLRLAPGEQVLGHHPANEGGTTYRQGVTIVGHTTPGALIFSDSGAGDYSFTGPAFVADGRGDFSVPVRNRDGINNYEFLIFDAFGHKTIRAFPILWLGFNGSESPSQAGITPTGGAGSGSTGSIGGSNGATGGSTGGLPNS